MAVIEWMLLAHFDDPNQLAICALHPRNEAFCYEPLAAELQPQLALTNASLNSSKGKRTEIASSVFAP
jgi:hypothetical protein